MIEPREGREREDAVSIFTHYNTVCKVMSLTVPSRAPFHRHHIYKINVIGWVGMRGGAEGRGKYGKVIMLALIQFHHSKNDSKEEAMPLQSSVHRAVRIIREGKPRTE
jgi:hypothetical protein